MSKTNNTVDFEFMISGIWLDVMRMGQFSEEEDVVDDVKWWKQHKKEINFAFRILAGLGLAESSVLSGDDWERGRGKQELEALEEGDAITMGVTPSKALMRLYGKAISRARDERLARKL